MGGGDPHKHTQTYMEINVKTTQRQVLSSQEQVEALSKGHGGWDSAMTKVRS